MTDREKNADVVSERLARAAGGDEAALQEVLQSYKPLVKKKCRAYCLVGGEPEDLLQEGMIGLFEAIRDYDGTKNASFGSFAGLCIDRQLVSAVRASRRQKHKPLNDYLPLDPWNGENERFAADLTDGLNAPLEALIEIEEARSFRAAADKDLSQSEKAVLRGYLAGLDYAEIAAAVGRDKKSVDNALRRIRKKLTAALGNQE